VADENAGGRDLTAAHAHEIATGPLAIRMAAVTIIAVAATLVVLREAAPVLVPVLVSVLLAYALEPIVAFLIRCRIPRVIAASMVYALLAVLITIGIRVGGPQLNAFIDDVPATIERARKAFIPDRNAEPGPLDRIRETADALRGAAAAVEPAPPPGVGRAVVVRKSLDIRSYLLRAGHGVVGSSVQVLSVVFLTFLLLVTGDLYKRKLVKLAGPALRDRRVTLEVIQSIDRQIERYLLVRLGISAIVAAATALPLHLLGVNHWLAWGIAAGVLNVLPFVGPTLAVVLIALAAFVQFHEWVPAAAAGGAALLVAAIEGNLITPVLMSRAAELNTVAVFVSVLVWGWVWDAWGLLLAVPIMVTVKAAADRIEGLQPLAELLSR
jgi:predicted PurR-regulated permease PerM